MLNIKQFIKQIPGFERAITQPRIQRFLDSDKKRYKVSQWMRSALAFVKEEQLADITFSQSGIWVHDRQGLEWACSPDLHGTIRSVLYGREYEKVELELLEQLLKPNDHFVDVGANIGLFSIQLGYCIPNLTVYAFEPVSKTFSLLQGNITRNKLDNIISAYQMALSDQTGEVEITSDLGPGNHLLNGISRHDQLVQHELVTKTTLDAFVATHTIAQVDLIKCDAEGAELLIMKGAKETLLRFQPILLLEINARWTLRFGYQPVELFQYLQTLGYAYRVISYNGEICPSSSNLQEDLSKGRNFLFTQALNKAHE